MSVVADYAEGSSEAPPAPSGRPGVERDGGSQSDGHHVCVAIIVERQSMDHMYVCVSEPGAWLTPTSGRWTKGAAPHTLRHESVNGPEVALNPRSHLSSRAHNAEKRLSQHL